jgi:hypothetical protein
MIRKRFRILLPLAVLAALASACRNWTDSKTDQTGEGAVAKAYDAFLMPEDLEGVVPAGASREDSAAAASAYVENWIRQQTVLHLAELNLDEEQKQVEKKLEDYRKSLLIHAYEAELVRQKLDTNVSEEEIESYYQANKKNFELRDNIIKVVYLKLSKKAPKIGKARELFSSTRPRDREALADYCRQYAVNYFLDDNTWLLFDDLLKEIPIKTYDKEQFLQNNRNIEIEDSTFLYLVSIRGFMIRNSTSPLSFERNNIRTLIINERKLKLIGEMEQQAYEEARKKGEVEVW